MTVKVNHQSVEAVMDEVIEWRRQFHRHPELSFQEYETSKFIYETLESFGLEVSHPTETSVMGRLIGNKSGKTLAIRADIDALPIDEENSFEFASQNQGVMHACGHDGHTAMLLGTAKVLSQYKDDINGEIRFLFQSGEEVFPGGAKHMVNAGVMEGVDYVIGAHLMSDIPLGKVGLAYGPMTAAADGFWVTIDGKGGHGAKPHDTVDSIVVGSQVVSNLQQIISRNVDPVDRVLLTIGSFEAGGTANVIADSVKLNGIVRWFDPKYRDYVPELMERILKGITDAHGADYTLDYQHGYAPINTDEYVTGVIEDTISEIYGEDTVQILRPQMGAEDYSAFMQEAPGTYFMIGARNEETGIVYPHHHPKFTVDEDALPYGVNIFVNAALKFLN